MTIKDLAARTGYSVGTISRVLNNQPNVSEKARTAILRAAEEYGFQLNENAKQLKQQHGNSILVVTKGTSNELFSRLLEAIQARIRETCYPLFVDYLDEDSNEVLHAVRLCREKKPLGILFLGGNKENFLKDFHKITVPCVLVTNDASGLGFPNLSSVSSDDVQAGKMAIDHLVSLGHRKIVLIGGDRQISDTARLRYQGCLEAFRVHGIEFDPLRDYEAIRFSYADGYRAAGRLMTRRDDFTAIFAFADVMAIGAIRALGDAGKSVPGDISVIGFDGLTIGAYTSPRLATIRQNVEELARQSVRLLLENIQSPREPRFLTIPVESECRESIRKI